MVQTYLPEHYAVQAAADQNYDRFYAEEMEYRRAQSNPPVSKLARLLYRNSDPKAGAVEAARFAGVLRRVVSEWDMTDVDIIGPAPSYPHRVRNAWRWQIIVRAPEPRAPARQSGHPAGMARRYRPRQHGVAKLPLCRRKGVALPYNLRVGLSRLRACAALHPIRTGNRRNDSSASRRPSEPLPHIPYS